MNINTVSSLNFNKNEKLKLQKQNENCFNGNTAGNFSINCYPKTYYLSQLSFGRRVYASDIIEKIGEENFPNPKIVEKLKSIGRSSDFSLRDIHLECYKGLLDCETLEEAKEKYPEFKDVIDIKNIDRNTLTRNSILSKILKGNIKGIDIDNFTLEMLKKYYGKLIHTNNKKEYWGMVARSVSEILYALNIKKPNMRYIRAISISDEHRAKMSQLLKQRRNDPNSAYSTDEYKAKRSKIAKEGWEDSKYREKQSKTKNTPEYKRKQSEIMHQRWQNPEYVESQAKLRDTDEYRTRMSQAMIDRWQDPNSALNSQECREKLSKAMTEKWQDPEYVEKQSKSRNTDEYKTRQSQAILKRWQDPNSALNSQERSEKLSKALTERWQDPEYREKRLQAKNKAYKKHPEIISMMSEVRKSFPRLGEIIEKKKRGDELTEEEKNYRLAYYRECEKAMPGYRQILSDEQQKILVELGLKEE